MGNPAEQTISGTVLNIVTDGAKTQREPCVMLASNAENEKFEVWLAYSRDAINGAKNLKVGDTFSATGQWCKPVNSHRTHNGLHTYLEEIPFFDARGSVLKV